ncbi:hypothetical protein M433DRAFT_14 [Acidomyces richmondensis BFW]|nr:MAG: hypothetical protein FE78DRAFT_141637 [Acidomyces sp. 'richmondensis']KYG50651.1 hypothetical protein M433DRAFT_14 [Acidomyces richmondensis BFW]
MSNFEVAVVVASQTKDDTTWLRDVFPTWDKKIYVTDDPSAPLTVPANRGREGMVYLTYIIDNYDALPTVIIFQHANRYQWHNDDPLYDGERMLSRLQIQYVRDQGYVNLRCVWTLGCRVEIHPFSEEGATLPGADPSSSDARAGTFYKHAFEYLFPGMPVPEEVGASCCAQFAVTAEKIRERPKKDYERYRRWLLETKLTDDLSGRIMEYSWHMIFGKESVHCPDARTCYCNVYGLCNLTCEEQGVCRSQYTLPKISSMPDSWPELGWEGEWRNVTQMRAQQELDYSPRAEATR